MPSFTTPVVLIITAAAAAAAALSSAGAATPEPIGMPGCDTTCGGVDVPYPFGMGSARCYHSPGFNLTCDRSHNPPRLLLGAGTTLRVVYIDLYRSTVRAMHAGSIEIDDDGGHGTFSLGADYGPCTLASAARNELILTGCNVQATVRIRNVTVGTCSSLCVDGDDRRDYPEHQLNEPNLLDRSMQRCSRSRSCQANIVISRDLEAADVQVQLQWLGLNRTKDQQQGPARVFIAQLGWSEQSKVHDQLLQMEITKQDALMEVPVMLEWEVVVHVAAADADRNSSNDSTTTCPADIDRTLCKSNHSRCAKGTRGGYMCRCDIYNGYDGNPYIPDGCKDVDECKEPELYSCYGECNNTDGSFVCLCPQGTNGDPRKLGGCVSHVTGVNCKRSCGGVEAPYPFGIGPSHCYLPGFNLTCDTSHGGPPRLLLRGIRVADISLENTTVRLVLVHGPVLYTSDSDYASNTHEENEYTGVDVFGSSEPYSLSTLNEVILTGCNAQVMLTGYSDLPDNSAIISGCSSFCSGNGTGDVGTSPPVTGRRGKYCYGRGCCQARISIDNLPTQIYFKWFDTKALDDGVSRQARLLIAEEGWFDRQYGNDTSSTVPPEVPVILRWEILQHSLAPANVSSSHPPVNCPKEVAGRICKSEHSHCIPGYRGYSCQCSENYHGNPYVVDGCTGGPGKPFRGLSIVTGVASGTGLVLLVLAAFILAAFIISSKVKHRRVEQIKSKFVSDRAL